MKTELLHGTLEVMILKTLTWGRMHGFGIGRWIEQQGGDALRIEEVTDPADPDSELYEHGELLPGPHATLAGPSFEEWLESEAANRPVVSLPSS
jgi:hypothetical protein